MCRKLKLWSNAGVARGAAVLAELTGYTGRIGQTGQFIADTVARVQPAVRVQRQQSGDDQRPCPMTFHTQ